MAQAQIATHLRSKSLPVSDTWLETFVASSRSLPSASRPQTALFRLLTSDFRDSLNTSSPSSTLPVDICDPNVQERRIAGPVPVQVLDIEDIGTSLWSQVEAIERVERGEAIRGREIVRTVNIGDDGDNDSDNNGTGTSTSNNSSNGGGPHRLILQDAAGTKAVGFELRQIHGVALGTLPIGAKMLLQNATVARGMVLLTPECVTLLGGKMEALDQTWREERKARLLARIEEVDNQET